MSGREHDPATGHDRVDLGAHALGLLDADAARAVEEHVASCPSCRAEWEDLHAMSVLLDDVPPEAFLDGPPDSDLVLARTLRQMRSERASSRRRRLLGIAAAAVVVAGALLGGGVAVGRATAPPVAVALPPAAPLPAGTLTLVGNGVEGTSMQATVAPARNWVRVVANVRGVPAGEHCRIIVVAKDGTRETAGSWIVPVTAETNGVTLNGSAAVAVGDVAAVVVENTEGTEYLHLNA
ncbi:zf-HC2 domain-containing protein [Pseudonocardia sp. GCM10023141]|uniref:zf-HC2 domain-containing protein n=1 Tax=Pseudonocardia sp. GCM10023141 TaxID=3252653 RepID=UPI003616FBCE